MITGSQIRGARAMLGWTQQQLADAAIISGTALKLLEKGATDPKMSTVTAIRDALEAAGIEFLPASVGKGPGVRLLHDTAVAQK